MDDDLKSVVIVALYRLHTPRLLLPDYAVFSHFVLGPRPEIGKNISMFAKMESLIF